MVVFSRRASLGCARLFLALAGEPVEGAEPPASDSRVVSLLCEAGDAATLPTGFERSPFIFVELLDALCEAPVPSLEDRFRGTSAAPASQPKECAEEGNCAGSA